jgi:U3 small nucleolar RNA-associated protein 14
MRQISEQNTNVLGIKSTINIWETHVLMKLQSFCKGKDTINRTKKQPTKWKKIVTNPTSDRRLISKIYKTIKNIDTNKQNNSIFKNWGSSGQHQLQATLGVNLEDSPMVPRGLSMPQAP